MIRARLRAGVTGGVTALLGAGLAAGAVGLALAAAASTPLGDLARRAWMLLPLLAGAAAGGAATLGLRAAGIRPGAPARLWAALLASAGFGLGLGMRFVDPGALFAEPTTAISAWAIPGQLAPLWLWLYDVVALAVVVAIALDRVDGRLGGAFCRGCGQPCHDEGRHIDRAAAAASTAARRFRERDWGFFARLGPPPERLGTRLRLRLAVCPCEATRTVRLLRVGWLRHVQLAEPLRLGMDDARTVRRLPTRDEALPEGEVASI